MEEEILNLCNQYPDGLTNDVILSSTSAFKMEDVVEPINRLLQTSQIQIFMYGSSVAYKRVTDQNIQQSLSPEEKIIYQHVKESGNKGIWTRTLKMKTKLHQQVLNRILKSLVARNVLKAVKTLKSATRKVYMLYDIEPSEELTGGPWFIGAELDAAFVDELGKTIALYVKKSTPTAEQVLTFLNRNKITTTLLRMQDVEQLLLVLEYDNIIERIDDRYFALDGKNRNYFYNIPCEICPIIEKCSQSGAVNPVYCEYLKTWCSF